MPLKTTDFLIIGGGVMGLTIALALRRKYLDASITIIEKEHDIALHASGRNSGVLHAGFYYTADSLKARFTRDGNRRWTQYCNERNLKINQCGKVVVARDEKESKGIYTLLERGKVNGVDLELVDEKQLRQLEPHAKTVGAALFSPTTASIDPIKIMHSLAQDCADAGIKLLTDTWYLGRHANKIKTSGGDIEAGYIVNAAGLYADKIAREFGYANDIRIFPFKGLFLHTEGGGETELKRHVYPVPDLRNPFLGVHFTQTEQGKTKIGPTAIPALWRENYEGFAHPKWKELCETGATALSMFANNKYGFRALALREIPKFSRHYLAHQAGKLVQNVDMSRFKIRGRAGIRAQPVNLKTRKLEMDFLFEGDNKSFHLLNAVSPAFTCALPFSEFLVEQIDKYLHGSKSKNPSAGQNDEII